MRFFFIICLSFLYGCSAQKHIDLSKKHLKKAIQKGAVINTEIETVTEIDTLRIYDTIVNDSTITIHKTIRTYEKGEIRYISKRDKREENRLKKLLSKYRFKLSKDSLDFIEYKAKQEGRTARTTVRQENKKSKWWLWLLIGAAIPFVLKIVIRFYIGK